MAQYKLDLANLTTGPGLGTVRRSDVLTSAMEQGQYLKFSYALNSWGAMEFVLPIDKPTLAEYLPMAREVHLYRREQTADPWGICWGGYLTGAVLQEPFVRFGCQGWFWRWRRRVVTTDLEWLNAKPVDVAWGLISWGQSVPNGQLGVTRQTGPIPATTASRTLIYCGHERPVIADAIDDLASQDDGFDFDITPGKVFTVWSPERRRLSPLTIDAGSQTATITGLEHDGEDIVTQLSVLGERQNCSDDNGITLSDPTALATYGLLQEAVQHQEPDERVRRALGQAELNARRWPRFQPSATLIPGMPGVPAFGTLEVGDELALKASRGYATFDARCRITGQNFEVRPGGVEKWTFDMDAQEVPS